MFENVLDFLRATETAAIAASRWVGTGEKLKADLAATEAMRERLNDIKFSGRVIIGEGKKDESHGLFYGDVVGALREESAEQYHIAVDPIDGTRPTVNSGPEALSVLAVGEPGSLFATEEFYMHKLAYGHHIAKKMKLHITDSIEKTIQNVASATGKKRHEIMVCLLERPRHEKFIREFRELGVRIKLIQDCDISGAIATCIRDSGIDILYGSGGAAEGVLTACAMKCLGGGFEVQLSGNDGTVRDTKVYDLEDLAKGECVFAATGITDGSLLRGVRFVPEGPVTSSVIMRSRTKTVRWVDAHHGDWR